jgi:hypothetical protein
LANDLAFCESRGDDIEAEEFPMTTTSNMSKPEFEEIAHSGGQVTFHVVTQPDGRRSYQVGWHHCRPVASAIVAVYALPVGIPVCPINLGGMGQPWNRPPVPGCFPVFISSDSEGKFGQQCPACSGYWRGDAWPTACPYCGLRAGGHEFLTNAQRLYVQQYCHRLAEALEAKEDGDHVIDMDAVADAVGKEAEKPPFYYAEVSQQNKFTCTQCGAFSDILGRFGYCSRCATRNDLQELETITIPKLRDRINAGGPYEDCARDAVAAFDSLAGQYARQLVQRIPLTPARKGLFEGMRFHNLKSVADKFRAAFDIDILKGIKPEDVEFAALLFHRRHVYEHNGGEADEKYIADSGDSSVRPKQTLRETQESAHRLAGLVTKIARNLHRGFHEILPPESAPIAAYAKWRTPMNPSDSGE